MAEPAGYGYTKTYKGLDYERDYNSKKYDTVHLTIPNVVKEYERLIAQKRFPARTPSPKSRNMSAGNWRRQFTTVSIMPRMKFRAPIRKT